MTITGFAPTRSDRPRISVAAALLFFMLLGLVMLTTPVAAANVVDQVIDPSLCVPNASGEIPAICSVDKTQTKIDNALVGPTGILTRTAQVLVYLSGAIAAIMVIIAGIMMVFSQGNSESVGRARSTALYAVIGVIVAITGQAIVLFVLRQL